MKTVKTHCGLCNSRCGVIAWVDGGRVVKVEGDPDCRKNEGSQCIRGKNMLEFVYDQDRLHYPLQREGDRWKRISWEEALEKISGRLKEIKSRYGAETVGFFRGMSVYSWLIQTYLKRFANLYGSQNFFSNAAICIGPKIHANKFTFGPGISTCGDFLRSKCILLFGTNPAVSNMHRSLRVMKDILRAKKDGAALIVVDPKRTATAAKADIHTTIRPGTDAALVFALLNVIIANEWYDRSFVERYTVGFRELSEHVREYSPERVEKITWVDRKTIVDIARLFAQTKPACADRREGIFHHENSTQTTRAINYLNIVTGNVDVEGGCVLQKNLYDHDSLYRDLTRADLCKPEQPSVSAYNPFNQDIPADLIKAIVDGEPYPIRALVVFGCNPVLSWPNTSRVLQAFRKLEFMFIVDVYRNDTASFADFVLPAAAFLEKTDLAAPNVAIPKIIQLQQQAIEPIGEARPETWIIKRLARSMGYGEYFQDSDEEVLDRILARWGLTVEDLRNNDSGLDFEPCPVGWFRESGFKTPSGKIEIFSEQMKRMGEDPLPKFREPTLSPSVQPEITRRYPLHLITGNRLSATYLSFLHNLPSLHKITSRDFVELHPDTAASRGIQDKEEVVVESPKGCITSIAKLNEKLDPRVVSVPYGWGHKFGGAWQLANSAEGESVNYLIDDALFDKISGTPNYRSAVCEVRKKL